jgi:hypothetical protein
MEDIYAAAGYTVNSANGPARGRPVHTTLSRLAVPRRPTGRQAARTDMSRNAGSRETVSQKGSPDPVSVTLELGWTMALLFGQSRNVRPSSNGAAGRDDRLPTEHELPPHDRSGLEVRRANSLVGQLERLLPNQATGKSELRRIPDSPSQDKLKEVNVHILTWLACAGREFSLGYQLGRSLRDTADPPLRLIELSVGGDDAATWKVAAECAIDEFAGSVPDAKDERKMYLSQEAQPTLSRLGTSPALTAEQQDEVRDGLREASRPLARLDAVKNQLSRGRVAKLQEWLVTLGPRLPADSTAIVSASVGRWCDLTRTIYDPAAPGRLRGSKSVLSSQQNLTQARHSYPSGVSVASELYNSLLPQGDVWLNLLTGAESAQELLTPEGYVAAAEAALRRSARIIRRIAVHYWVALVILLIALGGVIYFAVNDLSGASKVWTQIAAVAGALGVTSGGIGNRMAKLSEDAGTSVFSAEKTDAMAWAITIIPADLKLDRQGIKALRGSGITPPAPLGRV